MSKTEYFSFLSLDYSTTPGNVFVIYNVFLTFAPLCLSLEEDRAQKPGCPAVMGERHLPQFSLRGRAGSAARIHGSLRQLGPADTTPSLSPYLMRGVATLWPMDTPHHLVPTTLTQATMCRTLGRTEDLHLASMT